MAGLRKRGSLFSDKMIKVLYDTMAQTQKTETGQAPPPDAGRKSKARRNQVAPDPGPEGKKAPPMAPPASPPPRDGAGGMGLHAEPGHEAPAGPEWLCMKCGSTQTSNFCVGCGAGRA